VNLVYRRDHWCNDVAKRAHVRLITRLKNHNEFTQMADLGGENGSGDGIGGMDMGGKVMFRSARART
jgi:hypothetical protein